jgi:hypothetical protein
VDGDHVTRLAQRLHALADETRREADRMASTTSVDWRSTAADRYRERLAAEALRVRRAASVLDDAARALAVLARAVAGGVLRG